MTSLEGQTDGDLPKTFYGYGEFTSSQARHFLSKFHKMKNLRILELSGSKTGG
jgi:hypothetical protein